MFTETILCEIAISSKTRRNYKCGVVFRVFQFSFMSVSENTSYISPINTIVAIEKLHYSIQKRDE